VILVIGWVWVINLFNFMDGIDGIASGEAAVVGIGLVVVGLAAPELGLATAEAAIIAAAAAGFLVVNWHPARLFMGDVGSVGLGFLTGWLMVDAASKGAGWAALILPMYFLADASTTLVGRILRRRRLGQAHRDHAYQAAVDRGVPQPVVSGAVIALGLVLCALALASRDAPELALSAAVALVAGTIVWMRWGRQVSG
jgi:UDP-N-acetylmuramyl pentapeptide phosphotransferase/UDP-N-acetylglucosamine-1-phosphate transferase